MLFRSCSGIKSEFEGRKEIKRMKKMICDKCEELREEKSDIMISEVRIDGSYYGWYCPINFCPKCGRPLAEVRKENKNDN